MVNDKSTYKKANHGNKRGELKITEARNGMSRGTSASIASAKAYEETTQTQKKD